MLFYENIADALGLLANVVDILFPCSWLNLHFMDPHWFHTTAEGSGTFWSSSLDPHGSRQGRLTAIEQRSLAAQWTLWRGRPGFAAQILFYAW